jgi:hypothetical protein
MVKNLQSIEQLPINYTIMKRLARENKAHELLIFRESPKKVLAEKKNLNLRYMQQDQQAVENQLK